MKELIAFYRDRLEVFSKKNNWCRALKVFFLKGSVDSSLIQPLLDESLDLHVDTPESYLCRLRKLVSLSFFHTFQPHLETKHSIQKIYRHLHTQGFWQEFQIGQALYVLGCDLVGLQTPILKPKQLSKGGILVESGDHFPDGGVADLRLNGELALIWMFLGWKLDREELIDRALRWVYTSMGLFDHEGRPFRGVWVRGSEYHPLLFHSLYLLLFSVSSKIVIDPEMDRIACSLLRLLEGVDTPSFDVASLFFILLSLGFKQLEEKKPYSRMASHSYSKRQMDRSLGYASFRQERFSLACSFSGVNTGMGVFHKKYVRILSFGPHGSPLGDLDQYGVYRTSSLSLSQPFRDLEISRGSDHFSAYGWTRTFSSKFSDEMAQNRSLNRVSDSSLSKQWIYLSLEVSGSKMVVTSRLLKREEKSPFFFAYFIVAERAHIGSCSLAPSTLNRYQGENREIVFEKGGERLSLNPQTEGQMDVIPLAGEPYFWGADFLVAFLFEESLKGCTWEIE